MYLIIRNIIWSLLTLIFLIGVSILVINTDWFNHKLTKQIEFLINPHINGQFHIGKIESNIVSYLTLEQVSLINSEDTLLSIPSIAVYYSPTGLLNQIIAIDSVIIIHPSIHAEQFNDKTWNFQNIWRTLPDSTRKKDSSQKNYEVLLGQLTIINGKIRTTNTDSIIPKIVTDFNLIVSGKYANKNLSINLEKLQFIASEPDLKLEHLSLIAEKDSATWVLKHLLIKTQHNRLEVNGRYTHAQNFEAHITWPQIQRKEFNAWIPQIPLKVDPPLHLHIEQNNEHTLINVSVSHNSQSIEVNGEADNFFKSIKNRDFTSLYGEFYISTRDFMPSQWLDIPPLPLKINSTIIASGNGITPQSIPLKLQIDAANTKWEDINANYARIMGTYHNGEINGQWHISGKFGKSNGNATFNIKHPEKLAKIEISAQQLQLHSIIPQISDSSIISGQLSAIGTQLTTPKRQLFVDAQIANSNIYWIPIESLKFSGKIDKDHYTIDTLFFRNKSANITGNAQFFNKTEIEANLIGKISNTLAFSHYFSQPLTWHDISFSLNTHGKIDSIISAIDLTANQIELHPTLNIHDGHISGKSSWINQQFGGTAHLELGNSKVASIKVDSSNLDINMNGKKIDGVFNAVFANDKHIDLSSSITLDSILLIDVDTFIISTPYNHLQLQSQPARISINNGNVRTNKITIADYDSSNFQIDIQGNYLKDSITGHVNISKANLGLLYPLRLSPIPVSGILDAQIRMDGAKSSPIIYVYSQLYDFAIDSLSIQSVKTSILHANHNTTLSATLKNNLNDSLNIQANATMTIRFDNNIYEYPKELSAQIDADHLRMSPFYKFRFNQPQPNATTDLHLTISGNTLNPLINGKLSMYDGFFSMPDYGIHFTNINMGVRFQDKTILLDTLQIKSSKNYLFSNGQFSIDSSWLAPHLTDARLQLTARNFQAVKHHDFDVNANADLNLEMKKGEQAIFNGKVQVNESNFNLPAILGLADERRSRIEPMLITALKDTIPEIQQPDSVTIAISDTTKIPILDQLSGNIQISFPRNTWIRSDQMQMELYGDLELIKSGPNFDLFGTLGIHRGFYTLYGKRFIIDNGELTFTGSSISNPTISFSAHYVFRDAEKNKRRLDFTVNGTATIPEVAFTIDNQAISESDAVAYLIFGQPFDELAYGNKEGTSANLPSKAIGGLLATQLSKTLGNTFKIDIIEIDAGDNWQNTTFMIGKYLTRNLFVTYHKDFGSTSTQNSTPDIVTLEYEISRHLSLRVVQGDEKSTGADIIIKFESKKNKIKQESIKDR